MLNPPLSALPRALAARYTAPKRVGHAARRYPRLGAFEFGYVLIKEGGVPRPRDLRPPLASAAGPARRARPLGRPTTRQTSASTAAPALPRPTSAPPLPACPELLGHGFLSSKLDKFGFPSAARGAVALARGVQDDLNRRLHEEELAAAAAVVRMQREKAEAEAAAARAEEKRQELTLLGEAVAEAEAKARAASERGAPSERLERCDLARSRPGPGLPPRSKRPLSL